MNPANGIVTVPSRHPVNQTVGLLENALRMRPTKLLIFGSPKAGTPLMVASPSIALDLPLKLLVWEDADGKVWITYNAPAYLEARHRLPHALGQVLAAVERLAKKAGE